MPEHELSKPKRKSTESIPAGDFPGRVLLVDDDPEVRLAFATFLSRQSYDVQVVASAQEALVVLDRERFDVVVSDIRMPGMDGLQLLATVRGINPLIPVVLMTGNPELETAIAAVEQGALRYLSKPVDLEHFAVVIAKAVRLGRRSQHGRGAFLPHNPGSDGAPSITAPVDAAAPLADVTGANSLRRAVASKRSADRFFAAILPRAPGNDNQLGRLPAGIQRQPVEAEADTSGLLRARRHSRIDQSQIALLLDGDGRIALVNDAWRRFALENGGGPSLVEGVGLDYLAVCAKAMEPEVQLVALAIRDVIAKRRRTFSQVYPCHSERELRWFRIEVGPPDDDRPGAVLRYVDITEVYVANARLNIQMGVAKVFKPGMSMLEACRVLALKVCQELDWDYAGVWTLDVSSWTLRCVDTWVRQGLDLGAFQQATLVAALGPGVGLPGRAWATAKVQWATDLDTAAGASPGPAERARVLPPSALASGLRTALSFPIKCGDDTLAVVDVFSKVRRQPDRVLMELLEASGDQLALWELRQRAEECALLAQQQADNARSVLESVLDCAPAFVVAMTSEGIMRFVNRTLPPHRLEDVIGRTWHSFFPERSHAQVQAALDVVLSTGVAQNYELRLDEPGQAPVWLASHMGALHGDDRITGAVVVSLDITALKLAQAELTDAQRLAAMGTMAAGVAHEINTPVQFVGDSVHFLRDAGRDLFLLLDRLLHMATAVEVEPTRSSALSLSLCAAREAEEQADLGYLREHMPKAFDRAIEGLERVATIVRSMKEFAHPQQVDKVPSDINRAIVATLTVARNEYKYVADLETDYGELPPVTCHLNEINQVILNLVVNAAHAIGDVVRDTGRRGKITVSTRHEGEYAVVAISDTGGGIPEHVKPHIFEPFFTTKEVGRGTGQGLAIARTAIRDNHGGELTFESVAGLGTTFYVRLPLDGAQP